MNLLLNKLLCTVAPLIGYNEFFKAIMELREIEESVREVLGVNFFVMMTSRVTSVFIYYNTLDIAFIK